MANEEYYKNLPQKRMATGALFFNERNEILLVKPSYKDYWLVPGGIIEENESPKNACAREIEEELGLIDKVGKILCIDYNSSDKLKTEMIVFIFQGKVLKEKEINEIKIDGREITDFKFVGIDEALSLVNKRLVKRIKKSLENINNSDIYFESDY